MNWRYPESASDSGPRDLVGALFDFEALPGRYPLALREPRLLFNRSRDVLLLASSRPVAGLALDAAVATDVQRAACFFVRVAMLRPGADHYTVLGLEPGFKSESLRDHYRLLIRLTHPDFVASSGAWPDSAATRVNLANDVLGSAVKKAEYDSALSAGAKSLGYAGPQNRLTAILPRSLLRERPAIWGWAAAVAGSVGALAFVLVQLQGGNVADFHPDLVEQDSAQFKQTVAKVETASNTNAEKAVAPAKELKVKPNSLATDSTTEESRKQVAKLARLAKESQAAQAAKESQTAKMALAARAAQEAQIAEASKAALVSKAARDAQIADAAKAAQAIKTAKEAQAVQLAQAAKESQTVKVAQAAQIVKEALAAKQVEAVKLAQAQAVQTAKLTQTLKEPPTSKVALVAAVPPEAQPAQPVVLALAKSLTTLAPSTPTLEPVGRLNLTDAQPALNQLIQAMQAGRGDELLRGLDRSVRQSGGAADLVNAYNLLVAGSRAVRLGPVKLSGRPGANQLAVDGVVQLVLQDQGQPPPVRELYLRALFIQRDGQVVMTELSTGGARP